MSKILTDYRKSREQTLQDLASALGVDKSTLWRWEAGKVPVERLDVVERVTRIPRRKLRPDIFRAAS